MIVLTETIEKHRETLEDLAERDDLNCSKYARALLDAADSNG